MADTARHRRWAALNAAGLVGTLVMNGLANALPLNGKGTGELSDLYPNLFVPAGLTFSIWGLIYLLLLGFVGFQVVCAVRGQGERAALDAIGPWFVVSSAANSLWIVAWHWQRIGQALLLMLLLLASLLAIYLRLGVGRARPRASRRWLVELPVSVYLGWITVATIANVTTLLVDMGHSDLPPGPVFWTVTVILVAVLLAGLMILTRSDLAFASVVAWALLGIWLKRRAIALPDDDAVEQAALVGIVLIAIASLLRIVWRRRAPPRPEPLQDLARRPAAAPH
jgi:hypothetical protein